MGLALHASRDSLVHKPGMVQRGGEWCYDSDAVSPPGLMWEHWSSEGRCEAVGSLRSSTWEGSSGRLGMCLESVSSHQI